MSSLGRFFELVVGFTYWLVYYLDFDAVLKASYGTLNSSSITFIPFPYLLIIFDFEGGY